MPRKATTKTTTKTRSTAAPVVSSTPVRNTAIPPKTIARQEVTHEAIARRAYEISISGQGGNDVDNWLRAERELRGI